MDIRDAIVAIHRHIADAAGESEAGPSALLHDALLFQFVVIGEAVKHLDNDSRSKAPEVPWTDIAGLRDMIAHEYFRIDIERILEIVEVHVPVLESAVERLLVEMSAESM